MNDLVHMTIRDLIAARAAAEDSTRRARQAARNVLAESRGRPAQTSRRLAMLTTREDAILAELRRRPGDPERLRKSPLLRITMG